MKKFSIKAVLALVLILVLALSLVACGDKCKDGHTNENQDRKCDVCGKDIDKCASCVDADSNQKCDVCGSRVVINDDDNDQPAGDSDTAAFFQNLWDAAAPIGGTEIADNKDLAVSMDMSIALGNDGTLADLGVNIGLVLDRTNNGAHSAATIGVYDHENNEVLAKVYYFLDDPYVFYVEALGQSFQMAVDYNYNEEAAAIINGAITTKLGDMLGDAVADFPAIATASVMDIINNLVDDFGASWNLDSPINAVTGLLGVNIGELLGSEPISGYLPMVNGVLTNLATSLGIKNFKGIDPATLATSDQVVLDLLKGVGPLVFRTIEALPNGQKAKLDLSSKGIIGSVKGLGLLNNLPYGLGAVIDDIEEVSLQYTTDNAGKIDDFGINVSIGTEDEAFDLTISINDMAIAGVDAANAASVLGADKANFKPYFEVNTGLTIEIAPETLVVTLPGVQAMDFAGTYEMNLRGQIDLLNDASTGAANGTRLLATIDHNDATIARLTFDGENLALAVDGSSPVVKFIMEQGVSLLLVELGNEAAKAEDTWLEGLVLGVANVGFTGTFADVEALNAATSADFTINPALTLNNGVAITGINLSDIKTHGARLLASLGIPGFEAESSAIEDDLAGIIEQAWEPNIYTLLTLLSEAIDGNIKTGLTAEIDNIGEAIISLFGARTPSKEDPRTQTGPLTMEELCYGNLEEGIFGLFTMINGFDAKEWATGIFGQCAWAGDDILVSLMSSSIEVNVKSDLSGSINIANGDCYINISFTAGVTASDDAIDWSSVSFPNVAEGWATYEL